MQRPTEPTYAVPFPPAIVFALIGLMLALITTRTLPLIFMLPLLGLLAKLLHMTINLEYDHSKSSTALRAAVLRGDSETVNKLLTIPDIEINAGDPPALHLACANGNLVIVDALLAHKKININNEALMSSTQGTAFYQAAINVHIEVIEHFIQLAYRGNAACQQEINWTMAYLQNPNNKSFDSKITETLLIAKGLQDDYVSPSNENLTFGQWVTELWELRPDDTFFERDADVARKQYLAEKKDFLLFQSAKIFAVVLFFMDEYIALNAQDTSSTAHFLRIMQALPVELQMKISNLVYPLSETFSVPFIPPEKCTRALRGMAAELKQQAPGPQDLHTLIYRNFS